MKPEYFKAENSDEIIWLRLNRLKSVKLCENLIREKVTKSPKEPITEEIIKSKAIGLSSAIDSAIGYWKVDAQSLNAKVLSRYYFLLHMTIAEQVSSIDNTEDLKTIQKHTEKGHGLGIVQKENIDFPSGFYTVAVRRGHFHSYCQFRGLNTEMYDFKNKPSGYPELEAIKTVNIIDLFRRIPELQGIIEEYTGFPPYCFNVGVSSWQDQLERNAMKELIDETGELILDLPKDRKLPFTIVTFYTHSEKVTAEYLSALNMPFTNIRVMPDPEGGNRKMIVGELHHNADIPWNKEVNMYVSPYSTSTYTIPLWNQTNDNIIINFTLLYSLSIIVRYLPDLWYRMNSGDLNHYGSLIEYYISIIDHILPHQMLERITGNNIRIEQPGSIFGII